MIALDWSVIMIGPIHYIEIISHLILSQFSCYMARIVKQISTICLLDVLNTIMSPNRGHGMTTISMASELV
jgi:hypothetical protein